MNILKKTLPIFSYIFHPLFIPTYATLWYLFSNHSYSLNYEKIHIFIQVVIVTILIPILFFLMLRSSGKINSMMAPLISERKIPLIIQCFLIISLVRNGITIERYPELHFFFLGALVSTLIALLMLFANIKASVHIMGISALTLFVFGLSMHFQTQNIYAIVFLIVMNGFVASSRLEMKAHTIKELVIGFLLGCIPQLLLIFLWL